MDPKSIAESTGVITFDDFKMLPKELRMIMWEMTWEEEHPGWENKGRLVNLIQKSIKESVNDWGRTNDEAGGQEIFEAAGYGKLKRLR